MMNIINPMLYAGLPAQVAERVKSPKPKNLRLVEIDKLIECSFNVDIKDLKGKSRKREERALPRQLWHYLLRKHTELNLHKIGEHTNRNHATVLHSLTQVTNVLECSFDPFNSKFKEVTEKAMKL